MKSRILYVGTPCHDNRVHKSYHVSVLQLTHKGRYTCHHGGIAGGGVTTARNKLAAAFMASNAERILWLDGDISFTPDQIDAMWDHDLPIVGAFYAHKTVKALRWSCHGDGSEATKQGLISLKAIGTGGMMVKREVFEAMQRAFPERHYVEDWAEGKGQPRFAYFSEGVVHDPAAGVNEPTYMTEDWMFSYLARKCGYKVWGDTNIVLGHWEGSTMFPVQSPDEEAPAA